MRRSFRYEQIAEDLRKRISDRTFEGVKLPSERVLMSDYNVQRDTVRRALALLASDGLTLSQGRRGYFIVGAGDDKHVSADSVAPKTQAEPTGFRTVLVVTAWDGSSTALESIFLGLAKIFQGTRLSVQYFNSRSAQNARHHDLPATEYLQANKVCGVILWPQSPADVKGLTRLRSDVPLVLVDRTINGFEADSVGFDNVGGGRAITEHLISLGHRRIGFIGEEVFAETVQQRWRGYTMALEAAGIDVDPECVALFEGYKEPTGSGHLRLMLEAGGPRVTAIVCANDTMASHLLFFLQREGIRVPEDIAVTGFGDLLPNFMTAVGLTTMAQPFEELGMAAGRILLERLSGALSPAPMEVRHIELPVELIVRTSSGVDTGTEACVFEVK